MKKLLTPFTWVLDQIYILRTQHVFLTSSEVRKILHANDEEKQKLQTSIKAFSDSVMQLIVARTKRAYNGYEIRFHVSREILETKVGDTEAIGAIVVPLAKLILNRHHQTLENEKAKCRNSDTQHKKTNKHEHKT
jgi:hypothetical protein